MEIENKSMFITKATVSYLNKRESFENSIESISQELLEFAKLQYNYHLSLSTDSDSAEINDLFFWHKNYIHLWCLGVNNPTIGEYSLLYFATKSEIDKITVLDLVTETTSPAFYKLDFDNKIKFLIDKSAIPDISNEIIANACSGYSVLSAWVENWVKNEAKTIDSLISTPAELFEFNKSAIRARRYNFEDMLHTIDNEQFTMEFDECLYAYNNQKWFVCAAGLGGVLEHLLYLILEKNNLINSSFPDDATARTYIEQLSRHPIKIKKRDKTYIRTLFLTRNSVSHFNQGFTSKEQCANLMDGIKNIFNNYYVKEFILEDN